MLLSTLGIQPTAVVVAFTACGASGNSLANNIPAPGIFIGQCEFTFHICRGSSELKLFGWFGLFHVVLFLKIFIFFIICMCLSVCLCT